MVRELLRTIQGLPGCTVYPAASNLRVEDFEREHGISLPDDLGEFVTLTDGVDLFTDSLFPLYIHGLTKLQRANPLIIGESGQDDRSYNWFVIANDGNGDYLTIDLARERLGRCYESFFDGHGVPGSCPVIATSFTDLLVRAIRNRGNHWWWLREDFVSLGDAYDDEL